MSRQQIQDLEDRASQHYLRGEYDEAFRAWQEVLSLDPGNEQAAEGVRLSELLLAGSEGFPEDEPATDLPSRQGLSPEEPQALGDETLLLDPELLATIVHAPAGGVAKKAPAPEAPPQLDPDRQSHGFDFGSLEELESIPLFGDGPAKPGSVGAIPERAVSAPSSVTAEAQAANELDGRVQDLLAEARSMHVEGRHQEALGVLSRVAILDEANEAAQEMESEVRRAQEQAALRVDGWIAEGVQAFDRGEIEEARGLFEQVLAIAPGHREALHYLEAMPATGPLATRGTGSAPDRAPSDELLPEMAHKGRGALREPVVDDELPLGGASSESVPLARPADMPAVPREGAAPRLRAPASPPGHLTRRASRKPLLLGGGLTALVLAAVAGWWFLGGQGSSADPSTQPAGAARPGGRHVTPSPANAAAAADRLATGQRPDARSVETLISDAKASMGAGDFGAAVVAYNEILRRDPHNLEAKQGLTRAGEGYKAKKLELEQLDRVEMAFRDQEFTSALHVLYRLPKTVDAARLDRYKVNGWYNLGVVSLRAGECQQARAHFDEALAIRPGDEDARRMRAFAERYREAPKDRAFYAQVERLSFRGAEDEAQP